MKRVVVKVTAFNADGYSKVILDMTKEQVWIKDSRVADTIEGQTIDPKDFPEMVRFCVTMVESGQ